MSSNDSIDSNIERLTSEANERRDAAENWDTWNIRFLFIAGFAAICLVVTAIGVSKSNRRLISSSDELNRAKDSKLALDLRIKDGEIAHAKELAGKANQRAEELAQENLEIKGTINQSVAATLLREQELKAKNLATESKLEEERSTRLELEQSIAPRTLWIKTVGSKSNFDSLKPFAGMNVILEFLPDIEASRAAASIAGFVKAAGWNIVRTNANTELEDGVVIFNPVGAGGSNTTAAADALLDLLTSNGWQAHRFPDDPSPSPTIRITVGFKPTPYFLPQEIKDAMKDVKKTEEKARKWREDTDRRINELWERFNKPPQ